MEAKLYFEIELEFDSDQFKKLLKYGTFYCNYSIYKWMFSLEYLDEVSAIIGIPIVANMPELKNV